MILAIILMGTPKLFRYLFFSDYGRKPRHKTRIERAYMDGSKRFLLVNKDIIAPTSITVDAVNKRIFWTDSRLDHIQTVDFSGRFRYTCNSIRNLLGVEESSSSLWICLINRGENQLVVQFFQRSVGK